MVKQIGVRPADFRRDRLERHRLRAARQQQAPRRFQCGEPAFLGAQAFADY